MGALVPWYRSAALLAVVTAILGMVGAVALTDRRLLTGTDLPLCARRILDVAWAVELAAVDEPQFFDLVARAQGGVSRMDILTSLSRL